MKGFPKTLNTKEDYEYVKGNFPAKQWVPEYQKLLDSMKDWVPTGKLESADSGISDNTHKVTEEAGNESGGEKAYIQWELQEIPTCKLNRLGFTKEEVQAAIASQGAGEEAEGGE